MVARRSGESKLGLRVGENPWVCTECRRELNETDFPIRYLNGETIISPRCRYCLAEHGEPDWDDVESEKSRRTLSVRTILALAKASCAVCGSKRDLAIDHIVPMSEGGTNAITNQQILCDIHHLEKHTDDPKLVKLMESHASRRKTMED